MNAYCCVKVGRRQLEEVWGMQIIPNQQTSIWSVRYRCPRCYRITIRIGEEHNCPVSDWQPYECLQCHNVTYPPHTLLMQLRERYYRCLWCGAKLLNTCSQHTDHAHCCPQRPKHSSCACVNLYKVYKC